MKILLFTLWFLSLAIILVVQLRYASANYPRSLRWELLLIGTSFASGCVLSMALFIGNSSIEASVLGIVVFGMTFMIVFRFFFLQRIQRVIPKRPPPKDKNT